MRKIAVLLCAVVLLFSFCGCGEKYTQGVYEVTINASNVFNYSVGNEWQIAYTHNGTPISNSERWTVPLDTTKTEIIEVTITEVDKISDVGVGSLSVVMADGFETSTVITVTENGGTYKGCEAQWEITCHVKLLEKL